jgi:uncharacterized protein
VDGHCHPLLADPWIVDPARLPDLLTEARAGAMPAHASSTRYYRRVIHDLARQFGVAPAAETVLAARRDRGRDVARRGLREARVEVLLVDTGYPPAAMSLPNMRALLPCAVHEVFRIETCAEALLVAASRVGDFLGAFREELLRAAQHCVAFKTIVAYRSGLAIRAWPAEEVGAAYGRAAHAAREGGTVRLTDQPLLDALLEIALDVARDTGRPLQIHAGFGDPDIDLLRANPLLLRPLLENPRWTGVGLVVLHQAYPYVREASFLAAVWPQVYVDLSLALPFLGAGAVVPLIEILSLAPSSKLLYGSDLGGLPELFTLSAEWARASLGEALAWLGARENWGVEEARLTARRILSQNALELYQLGSLS